MLRIWVVFLCTSINFFPQPLHFKQLTTADGLASNMVYDILQDRTGIIWFATDNGLNCYNGYTFKTFRHDIKNEKSLAENSIRSITQDSSGNIWIGTKNGWLNCYDPVYGKFRKWQLLTDTSVENSVTSVYEDSRRNIWIGTQHGGLYRLNPDSGELLNWLNRQGDDKSLSSSHVTSIIEDNLGRIWVSTYHGLNVINPGQLQNGFLRFYHAAGDPNSLSDNIIRQLSKSSNESDIIWIGTANGITRLHTDNLTFMQFEIPNPKQLPFAASAGGIIEELSNGNSELWTNTTAGLIRYSPDNDRLKRFFSDDGGNGALLSNRINKLLKDRSGNLWLATSNGVNYFPLPNTSRSDVYPPVVFADFQLFNRSVGPGKGSPLNTNIGYAREVQLSHDQNVITFQFAALEYISPGSIRYRYKMEGYDKDWINGGNRRFATYANLNPGEYMFKVRSSNSYGSWNSTPVEMKVIILPSWWQSGWAISLYIIVFILGAWGIIRFQVNRSRLQHELKMREFESHHLREIESMKSRFFTNLSHEFRTPLMLIKGPLEQLINGRIKTNLIGYYKMILLNAEKLQGLIDEMLELSQLEAETIPLHKQQQDIVKLAKTFTLSFIPIAEQTEINLSFNSSVESIVTMIDREKLEKVITNLLSNAFKFTPVGGKISVEISLDKQEKSGIATIAISDSGMGIPEEHRSKIFDRFYQIDDSTKRNYGSSGIGLALVKELVSLQNWNISVFSKVGLGTVFTLRIPVESLTEEKSVSESGKQEKVDATKRSNGHPEKSVESGVLEENNVSWETSAKPGLLLIEDSEEVRNYVAELLGSNYRIFEAAGGEEGIELALHHMPDLIISDVMMDGMDGYELCRRIKEDWQTSHIPVILLTARATKESKIEGLETGADDFITKPFSYEELEARVKNLIEQRKKLKEKFGKELNIKSDSIVNNPVDKAFLDNIIHILQKNLSNEKFDSEMLAEEIHVSRRQLYRKLHAISGQTPGEFIRLFKLKQAAQMLIENNFGITRIALEIGFSSPSQFTKAFKKYFGCLPSVFKEKHNRKAIITE